MTMAETGIPSQAILEPSKNSNASMTATNQSKAAGIAQRNGPNDPCRQAPKIVSATG